MRKSQWVILLFGCIPLFSCDPKTVFDNYSRIEKPGWDKDSLKTFSVTVTDTLFTHNIYLNLRNRIDYNYSNIWLFIGVESPDGVSLKDTVQFSLADPSGRWTGKGFAGMKDNRFLYRNNVYFPHAGIYRFTVQHGMRQELLTGISDVGFRIEKK